MAQDNPYEYIVVETYYATNTSGLHGPVHVRPVPGEKHSTSLHVECSKSLVRDYAVGTRFRIRAKLTDREGGGQYLYSYFGWNAEIVS
jgi:hypothetical protein